MIQVLAYDADPQEEDALGEQLRRGLGLDPAASWRVSVYHEREEFLADIEAHAHPSLAVVDLQRLPGLDTEYAGHRLIETIRRNPALNHAKPIAFTAYGYPDVIDLVRKHGGYGLVAKQWVDSLERGELERLRKEFGELVHQPPADIDPEAPFILRSGPPSSQDDQAATETEAIYEVLATTESWFGSAAFWSMMRHLAIGPPVGVTAVIHWTHAEFGGALKTHRNRLDRLKESLAPRYQVHGWNHHGIARELLKRVPHRCQAPDEVVSFKHLRRLDNFAGLFEHGVDDPTCLLRRSRVDREALRVLRLVVDHLPDLKGNQDQQTRVQALGELLRDLDPQSDGTALMPPLIRAVNGIADTAEADL